MYRYRYRYTHTHTHTPESFSVIQGIIKSINALVTWRRVARAGGQKKPKNNQIVKLKVGGGGI